MNHAKTIKHVGAEVFKLGPYDLGGGGVLRPLADHTMWGGGAGCVPADATHMYIYIYIYICMAMSKNWVS